MCLQIILLNYNKITKIDFILIIEIRTNLNFKCFKKKLCLCISNIFNDSSKMYKETCYTF